MTAQDITIIPVILCGGSGARLWPMSREEMPKQFLSLGGQNSLLVDTIDRALKCSTALAQDVVIVTLDTLKARTIEDVAPYDIHAVSHLLGEPEGCNTAAAIAYAAAYVKAQFGPRAVMWVLPADHYVGAPAALADAVEEGIALSLQGHIVTFGMTPHSAETGYGYIAPGTAHHNGGRTFAMNGFTEKPDRETAAACITNGYLWNSGMFMFTAQHVLDAFDTHAPEYRTLIALPLAQNRPLKSIPAPVYAGLPRQSFDKAIMEKISHGAVIRCDIGWSDIGTWESLWQMRDKDARGNSVSGRAAVMESADCLIQASSLLVAAIGLQDVAIIEHGDTVLVADKKNPDAMRALVDTLNKVGAKETRRLPFETRPWGSVRILSESPGYKVKEITILPGARLATEYHLKRCEIWTVVRGTASVMIGDTALTHGPNQHSFIPIGTRHSLENSGTDELVIIEVQCGSELGEDDTIRDDNDRGRNAA